MSKLVYIPGQLIGLTFVITNTEIRDGAADKTRMQTDLKPVAPGCGLKLLLAFQKLNVIRSYIY